MSEGDELRAFFTYTVGVLERLGIPYMVVGGYAATFYGEPRLTLDVDVVADMFWEQIPAFVAAFPSPEYYVSEDSIRDSLARRYPFNVIESATAAKVDVVPLPNDLFNRMAFHRRQRLEYDADGHAANFISPEDIVVAKLIAHRSTNSDKHLRDAQGVLLMQWGHLDLDMIRRAASAASVLDAFETILMASGRELEGEQGGRTVRVSVYRVPFDKGELAFHLPPGWRGTVVASQTAPPIEDVPAAVANALANPSNSPPLRDLARAGDRICVVFTDITRASPDHVLVPPVLAELEAAGVRDEDITLLCGIGLHRPSTPEEKVAKLGQAVVDRYRVIDNEPLNPDALVDLGRTESGIPLSVNRVAYEADLLIATGIVEPHQYAGYSGGRKTLAVGAAGEAMIAYTHGPQMVDHPGTRLGRIKGNPFHAAISEAARRAGLRFIVNVVQDDQKQVVYVAAGEPEATFQELVTLAKTLYEVPVPRQYDLAVAGVGYPKDANLYQASRAASYLFFAPTPVVRPGGFFIVPAPCEEGAGDGVGEQRFLKAMQAAPDIPFILDDARRHGYPPGQQRAFVMAKVLEQNEVIIVGAVDPDLIRSAKFLAAPTMEAAFEMVTHKLGDKLEALVVPHALLTLPIVKKLPCPP